MDEVVFLSAAEAGRKVGVAVSTITYWINESKTLPASKVGNTYVIRVSDLNKANAISLAHKERMFALKNKSA